MRIRVEIDLEVTPLIEVVEQLDKLRRALPAGSDAYSDEGCGLVIVTPDEE